MGRGCVGVGRQGSYAGGALWSFPLRPLRVHLPRFAGEDEVASGEAVILPCEAGEVPRRGGGGLAAKLYFPNRFTGRRR